MFNVALDHVRYSHAYVYNHNNHDNVYVYNHDIHDNVYRCHCVHMPVDAWTILRYWKLNFGRVSVLGDILNY